MPCGWELHGVFFAAMATNMAEMTLPSYASDQPAVHRTDTELADDRFWLSKLDESLPRSHIVPDFKRIAAGPPTYRGVEFTLDPQVIQALKSVDMAPGVSDLVLCASLLTMLLAKYDRHDELISVCARPPAYCRKRPWCHCAFPAGARRLL